MDSRAPKTSLTRTTPVSDSAMERANSPRWSQSAIIQAPVSSAIELHRPALQNDTLLLLIWRQRTWLMVGSALGLLAAVVYVFVATPLWSTEATLIARSGQLNADGADAVVGEDFLNTQCELIKSSPVLAIAIGDVDADNLELFSGVPNRISFLKKNLSVEVTRHSYIIDVSMLSHFPDDAKKVIDSVINAYREFQHRQALAAGGKMLSVLQDEKNKLDADLDTKTQQLNKLQSSLAAADVGQDNSTLALGRLATISSALTTAQIDTLTAKSAYEQTARSAGIDTSKPDWAAKDSAQGNLANGALDDDTVRARLFELQQQMSTLRRQYLPGHPAIQALQSHINELSRAIVSVARQRWLTAQDREKELQNNFDAQQKLASARSDRSGDVTKLNADISRLQGRSDSLDLRIKDLAVASQSGSFTIQTVEEATNSDEPVWPSAVRLLPLGLLAGAAAGMALGLVREGSGVNLNLRAMRGGGGKTMLGLPVFASVPRQAEVSIKHVAWSAHLRPESTIAIAFRSIRDALQASSASDSQLVAARTILIASPINGQGRTIAASNLAITLAKSGKSVCLIDADLRLPSLGKIYGLQEGNGLTSVLTGSATLSAAVQRTVIERLDLLPAGPPVEDPAALLNSPHFAETLEDLTMKYDHVVLDSSSVLGAADARIIAASCHATLLLLSQEGTSKRVAEQCRDGLVGVGATVIGIIVNSAPKAAQRTRDDRGDRSRVGRKTSLPEPRSSAPQLPHTRV